VSTTADTIERTASTVAVSASDEPVRLRHPAWQLGMLVLSVYALVSLSIETMVVDDPELRRVLQVTDLVICAFFLIDFVVLLATAPDRRAYLRWGWLDLIASIPMIDPFRWGRLARIVRVIRILRAVKSFRVIFTTVRASPFKTLSVMTFLVVFFSFSIAAGLILGFESGVAASGIATATDALWWSLLSILNAKAGVPVPVSAEGILLGVYLNKIGLLLFAYLNGSIIAWLISSRRSTASGDD